MNRLSFFQRVESDPGGNGNLIEIAPMSPAFTELQEESNTSIFQLGTAQVGDPGLIGKCSSPIQFDAIGHPVSVCHQ